MRRVALLALTVLAACGEDDPSSSPTLEEMCEARADACVVPGSSESFGHQCTLAAARRDCILAARSCEEMLGCYMGPFPDGGSSSRCETACGLCDVDCAAECAAGSACLDTAASCDAIADCS